MQQPVKLKVGVRQASPRTAVLGIEGDITGQAEAPLMEAYGQASSNGARTVVLDFTCLDYLNSSGIGLLVTMLIRAQRQGQRLLAFGLNDHYRQIFELTQLNKAIGIYASEDSALAAAG